jgi:hypothetical protein
MYPYLISVYGLGIGQSSPRNIMSYRALKLTLS